MSEPLVKKRKTGVSVMVNEPKITDSRFANIQSDPRYKLPGKREKIKVDKRFAKALQDDDFSRRAKVDRYGRQLENDSERRRLKRKYDFEEEDEEEGEEPKVEAESDDPDDDDEVQAELQRIANVRDVLREGKDVSSSEEESSSDESEEEEEEEEVDEVGPGLQDRDVPMGEVSSRLAVVNLDWDNIRAADLMAVFQSFLPATGRLLKVAVYPSVFGKERMEREEMEGPPKEIFGDKNQEDASEDEEVEDDAAIKDSLVKPDDGSEFDSTALRQYQLDRLRYFYAVLTFSDPKSAKSIYDAVDGTEYLSTANFFDLRFVPDETDFSEDTPREECDRIPAGYKPNEFVTDALQHSKVKLTWDAEDTTRKEAQARAFRSRKEIDEDDLKVYLGSDSESEAEADEPTGNSNLSKKEAERQRMRALLGLAPEPVKKSSKDKKDVPLGNIQITFSSGLSGQAAAVNDSDEEGDNKSKSKKKRSVFENSPEPDETTVERYARKEKERKQRRKEKMKATRNPDSATTLADADLEINDNEAEDQGFDDAFFAEPSHDAKSASKQRKAERLAKRASRQAEEAASAAQRAELEAIMVDDANSKGRTAEHFDMNDIKKAEKAASKKNKKKMNKKDAQKIAEHEAVLADDDFQIDTEDPRFARVFENHEFAIDPTNPRFTGTKGMKALLEEGRSRKQRDSGKDGKSEKKDKRGAGRESELMGLVEKIKRKNR